MYGINYQHSVYMLLLLILEGARASTGLCVYVSSGVMI